LAVEAETQTRASDEMLERACTLQNNLRKPGKWSVRFTAAQINGWLAVDREKNHPGLLPPFFTDPRVAIESGRITSACRYEEGMISTVLSLTVEPYVPEKNVIAVRLVSARAGRLPLPLGRLLDGLSDTAKNAELNLQWQQAGGDPVALFTLPQPDDGDGLSVTIENIRLDNGEIVVSGVTERHP
jgi:hypothetical protein